MITFNKTEHGEEIVHNGIVIGIIHDAPRMQLYDSAEGVPIEDMRPLIKKLEDIHGETPESQTVESRYLRPKEACAYLGIGVKLLRDLTKDGTIPSVRFGRKITVYDPESIDRAMKKLSEES